MEAKLLEDLKQAQLNRDEVKVSTLRLLISEINNAKIAKGEDLSDDEITSVVQRELKKRREAILAFRSGGREETALKEESEAKILELYLPSQFETSELTKIVEDTISEACKLKLVNELGDLTGKDMGIIMKMVMEKVKGRAEGARVSKIVKEKLS